MADGSRGTAGKSISIENVGKTYDSRSGARVEALRDVSLEIRAGEFLAIVGPSGCGKSTLLYLLAGFLEASSGTLRVAGERVTGPDIDRSMVFQSYALFPWLTVRGNVEFGLERKGLRRRERREIADGYLRLVGLQDFAGKHVHELSGGMTQRVAIARAFAVEPSVIFMDEPFGVLDALTRRFMQQELLRIWRERERTVVFITHSVPEALFLADRVVVMTARPGRIKSLMDVPLAHPRDTLSGEFRDLERAIYADLDEELAKTFALDATAPGSAD